ncbi:hypothetical protein J437_LFUL007225 [Ladona fulva]|uniref:Fibrinogen C-terminal domain-containing protein n=1 Tax=Ladona fulva TaxID=123851 RepID=A0A8K0K492_LADFU|nr:hypothetical protein J437_LFUL007225 [Ladona fulva]
MYKHAVVSRGTLLIFETVFYRRCKVGCSEIKIQLKQHFDEGASKNVLNPSTVAPSQIRANTTSSHVPLPTSIRNSTDSSDVDLGSNASSKKETELEESILGVNRRKLDDHDLYLLQRISDRLTALMALDEQQLRRLETLEYRMTRLESQNLDRVEGIRSTVADMSHRIQDMEREFESIKSALELVHQDAVGLRRGQVQLRREIVKASGLIAKGDMSHSDKDGASQPSEAGNADTLNKLQLLMPTVYSILGSIGSLQSEISTLRQNLTNMSNMTRFRISEFRVILMLSFKGGKELPEDCLEIMQKESLNQTNPSSGKKKSGDKSGVYLIHPKWSSRPFFVYCDMVTGGGGWTVSKGSFNVIQNRYEGTVDFFRDWRDYKNGFGNLAGEFWLGLEKLHLITNTKVYELLIQLEDFDSQKAAAKYNSFAIASEAEGYQITLLGDYQGDAGDSLSYHVGMKFSTHDFDQDEWLDGNCAQSRSGAWWYKGCEASNLNGRYLNGHLPPEYENQGIYWQDWLGPQYSLMKSRMSIRPRDGIIPKAKKEDKVKDDDDSETEED